MARILVVTSGKGGVGKTTSAINIAAGANKFGKEVVIIDANITTPNVGIHLGAPSVPVSLNHVLSGKAKLQDAIYKHHSGIKVIPSSIAFSALKGIKPERLGEIARNLKKISDLVIIDCAAGLGREALIGIQAADDVVIITNAEMPALTDALKTIRLAEELDKNVKGVIVTRYRNSKNEFTMDNIENMLESPVIALIPEDDAVKEALRLKDAVIHTHPRSKVARSYMDVTAKLLGKRYVDELAEQEEQSAFRKLLKKIGLAD